MKTVKTLFKTSCVQNGLIARACAILKRIYILFLDKLLLLYVLFFMLLLILSIELKMTESNKESQEKIPLSWHQWIIKQYDSWKEEYPKIFASYFILNILFSSLGVIATVYTLLPDFNEQFIIEKIEADIRSEYGEKGKLGIVEMDTWVPFRTRKIIIVEFNQSSSLNLNFNVSASAVHKRGNQTISP